MYKKTLMLIIMLMTLSMTAEAINGTVYEHVCHQLAAWQRQTGLGEQQVNISAYYQFSLIGEEEFHKDFRLPMNVDDIAEKCRAGFIKQVPYLPTRGMVDVTFKDALPGEPQLTTSIPVIFLEFVIP